MTDYDAFRAEVLFEEMFWRWYGAEERQAHTSPKLRADAEQLEPGKAARDLSRFDARAQQAIISKCEGMAEAARQDWNDLISLLEFEPDCLRRFLEYWTVDEARRLAVTVEPSKNDNDYVVLCCELGAALGKFYRQRLPEAEWVADMPYWESWLYHPPTGTRINVFHTAIRELSTSRPDTHLLQRFEALCSSLASRE